eukprot:319438_1
MQSQYLYQDINSVSQEEVKRTWNDTASNVASLRSIADIIKSGLIKDQCAATFLKKMSYYLYECINELENSEEPFNPAVSPHIDCFIYGVLPIVVEYISYPSQCNFFAASEVFIHSFYQKVLNAC